MTKLKHIAYFLGATAMLCNSANASSYLELGATKKTTITALGKAPLKTKKELNLGEIRTREARLPNGVLTLADRMRLRAKQAIRRQNQVSTASRQRKQPHTTQSGGGDLVME
ncbi:MAG: hypothetical protein V3V04_07650 [Rhizobiaceae bacterium]